MKYASFKLAWAHIIGPFIGGALAGLWKQYDARVKVKLNLKDNHPYNRDHSVPAVTENMI